MDFTPLPLGLVLRSRNAPTQAEVLAFDLTSGQAPPLATFAAVLPEVVVDPYLVFPHDAYAEWLTAHPASPVAAVDARGIQAHYATQEQRDLALAAALQDPAVEGVFTPQQYDFWTYPEHPEAGRPFALFAAGTNCYHITWWGLTPVPFFLDVTTDPITLVSPGHVPMCGVPPPQYRRVFAWHLPGLPEGAHTIAMHGYQPSGHHALLTTVDVTVVAGGGAVDLAARLVPATGEGILLLLAIGCALLGLHRIQRRTLL